MTSNQGKSIIILGAGGHAKVVADVLIKSDCKILGLVTPEKEKGSICFGCKVLGDDDVIDSYLDKGFLLANGIGFLPGIPLRWELAKRMRDKGFSFVKVIHPSAIISDDVVIDDGVQIMAGSILQPGVHVGRDSIINTGTCVDHDCDIGQNCHLAPNVTLSGNVTIENGVHVGTGTSVIQNKKIGLNSVIAAASVIYHDIPDGVTYIQPRHEIIKSNRS